MARTAAVPSELEPVRGVPALRLSSGRRRDPVSLVVADLHLGLGGSVERPLGPPEASAPGLAAEIERIVSRVRADGLIIAGDAKHPIAGTPAELRPILFDFFARLLSKGLAVELVTGNHDAGIARHLPREVVCHPATGIVRYGVGIFHGHAWPARAVLRSERIVAGHLHPGVRFAPTRNSLRSKLRAWVRVELDPPRGPPRARRSPHWIGARTLIVLPAFNPVAGIEALNRERPGRGRSFLYGRFLARGEARAYLLDGTDVGALPRRWVAARPK